MHIIIDPHQPAIHVVVAFGGSHDEAWESNQMACFDEEVAKEWIAQKEAEQEQLFAAYAVYEAALNAERERYVLEFPRPARLEGPEYESLEVPKWIGVPGKPQVITDEMREERNAILLENARRHEASCKPIVEYDAAFDKHFEAFNVKNAKAAGISLSNVKKYSRRYGERFNYRIETVPLLQEMDTFGL